MNHNHEIQHLPAELKDTKHTQEMPATDDYTKTLGIQWNSLKDCFKLHVPSPPPRDTLTKRGLFSDVAKTFDALGWFSPSTIKAKILMQQLWELKVDWDYPVPEDIHDAWFSYDNTPMLLRQEVFSTLYRDPRILRCF